MLFFQDADYLLQLKDNSKFQNVSVLYWIKELTKQ